MTLDEIETMCEQHEVAVGYLGWASRSRVRGKVTAWACTIQPAMQSSRWKRDEFFLRGKGPTLEAAIDDAAAQLAAFLLTRPVRPADQDDV